MLATHGCTTRLANLLCEGSFYSVCVHGKIRHTLAPTPGNAKADAINATTLDGG